MDYERARYLSEETVFDWYGIEQGWYDQLPAEAIEQLHECIADTILRAVDAARKEAK